MQKTISPIDGEIYIQREHATGKEIEDCLTKAHQASTLWKNLPLKERVILLSNMVDQFVANKEEICEQISRQMGRPIKFCSSEVNGFEERARHMIAIAPENLNDLNVGEKEGFTRFIRKDPLGIVFVVAPWNYPYLTAVNSFVPALLAGNVVIMKHSSQTPLCAEQIDSAMKKAGLPDGVFQYVHLSHTQAEDIAKDQRVNFVAFTGSVPGGRKLKETIASRFIGIGLELGGKDPAYVREDANIEHAVENLVDGSFFNSGQSCCGIERIYVHERKYKDFLEGFTELTKKYILGNPLDSNTTLGPVVRSSAAGFIRSQTEDAIKSGATKHIDENLFPLCKEGSTYLAPQVLSNVDHSMRVMTEETFGPVVGIMSVKDDEEAIKLMNDSIYGLTAAIWTADKDQAIKIGDKVETGTWFMNRCDYLDPALAWTGVKETGFGCTLSSLGYNYLTRPKSFHLRTQT